MVSQPTVPSANPIASRNFAAMFRQLFKKMMQGVDGQLPCIVLSYDKDSNTAKVMPLIDRLTTKGARQERETIAAIPVLTIGAGGFFIWFNVKPGDKGWIEASDRDISLFMQAGAQAKPNTIETHIFSSGRFVPDVFKLLNVSDEDANGVVISSIDGLNKIAMDSTGIRLTGTNVTVTATGTALVTAPTIDLEGALTLNGKPFLDHKHGGVQHGTDLTDVVTP